MTEPSLICLPLINFFADEMADSRTAVPLIARINAKDPSTVPGEGHRSRISA